MKLIAPKVPSSTEPKTLILRLIAMRAENVDLSVIVAGLERFKADLEAQGVEVLITVKGASLREPPLIVVKTESEPVK